MSANIPKNSAQKARKKARKQAADTARKRSLTVTNGLLATGTCCLIVASMLIMYSKTRALTFGMPGGLFLCALGAGCVGLSYFDVAKKFAVICFAAAVITLACAVVTLLGALGIVN
jgi:hypothetical protein